jgi:hypothetical protein
MWIISITVASGCKENIFQIWGSTPYISRGTVAAGLLSITGSEGKLMQNNLWGGEKERERKRHRDSLLGIWHGARGQSALFLNRVATAASQSSVTKLRNSPTNGAFCQNGEVCCWETETTSEFTVLLSKLVCLPCIGRGDNMDLVVKPILWLAAGNEGGGGCLSLSRVEVSKTDHIRDFVPNLEKCKVVQFLFSK